MTSQTRTALSVLTLALCAAVGSPTGAYANEDAGRNRLSQEMSPYLLQHASNPVEWYPWGKEAFEKARKENKPIFLSIGYSTCYWCHVMEEESFTNAEVAAVLNRHFVSIKVDREERPDLDEIYMTAVQILTGRGGWPMSTWLTPEGKPFHGGTYFPKKRFIALLNQLASSWSANEAELRQLGDQVSERIHARQNSAAAIASPDPEILELGVQALRNRFDAANGGFARRPKFPNETGILFLLDQYERNRDVTALAMARKSLEGMARGGIHDHLGGGFHRYSVDAEWQVPHFEKMLYNQAWLGRAYLSAFRITGDPEYRSAAEGILEYVLRDLTSPRGAFFSAEDAGHVGKEGEFYAWRPEEIVGALGRPNGELFNAYYGVSSPGNFEHGTSTLTIPVPLDAFAASRDLKAPTLASQLASHRKKLAAVRDERERPFLDDKILAGWNGMMIGTFAQAGRILQDPRWTVAAERAALSVLKSNRHNDTLIRAWRKGVASGPAFQEDYAWIVDGFLELYDTTGKEVWLRRAKHWNDRMLTLFWDEQRGGLFQTSAAHESLLSRVKDPYDGAVPSGNSTAAWNLVRLSRRTGNLEYLEKAETAIGAFAADINRSPGSYTFLLRAIGAFRHGESGPLEYGERGVLRAHVVRKNRNELVVRLDLRDGWHVNANPASLPQLVPTAVQLRSHDGTDRIASLRYPEGQLRRLGFAEHRLALYEGSVEISVTHIPTALTAATPPTQVVVRYQACNDKRCLAPQSLNLEIGGP